MRTLRPTSDDVRLRDGVMERLEQYQGLDAGAIGVRAREGIVTLTGFVSSDRDKLMAERLVRHAPGVRAVANDLQVWLGRERWDTDLARDVVRALEDSLTIPDAVHVVVDAACVTLTGTVNWHFQRNTAEDVVRRVAGVRGVVNRIRILPLPRAEVLSHWVSVISGRSDCLAAGYGR